jgi:peptidoglycan/LPS O-acetylase OafA/YrhL
VSLPHYGGLDGLRALAVVAVLLYHGGVTWAPGGFLGVEMFFVLSGFLITSLLVSEWAESATIVLRSFWERRARRLLPALFVVVLAIGVYYALAGATKAIPGLKNDGIATLLYFSNWHQIAAGTNYFAASGPLSPLEHTWSLAIEEQFYVVWPLVVLGVLALARRRGVSPRRSLQALLGLSLTGVVASAIETGLLFDGGRGLDRVYYGTDTRAASLLVGASLAIALTIRRRFPAPARLPAIANEAGAAHPQAGADITAPTRPRARVAARDGVAGKALGGAAVLALAALVAGIRLADGDDGWLYPYGLVGIDGAMLLVIGSIVLLPTSPVARALAVGPLQGIGKISYGLYLWHFPLFLWLDESSTGLRGVALLGFRLAVVLAVSVVSYFVLEQPIRQRRRPAWVVRSLAPVGAGAAFLSLLMATAASSLPVGIPAAAKLPHAPADLRGASAPCQVTLTDKPQYGVAPVAPANEANFEYGVLGKSTLVWSGSGTQTFHVCPPKRAMVIGDSLAFTLGVPMMDNEQNYGIELANASLLGCSFGTRGQLNVNGTWQNPPARCMTALSQWSKDEKALHPQEVIVEMGYRDEFDWRWNGKVVHLGQPAFDAYVQRQIDRYVQVLGRGGVKVLFLSVPYTHPPDQPDGSPAPAASPVRHAQINAMLQKEAREHPGKVQLLDIDTTVSPGNHYTVKVDGQLCRFDGIHFSVFCAKLVEPNVLTAARKLLGGP